MRISELYGNGCLILKNAGVDNYRNEARWIFEAVFECGNEYLLFNSSAEADSVKAATYFDKIKERSDGIPVQYVIGSWDFYGESYAVGKGVLIPRPETELLVDFALDYLENKANAVVYDLCSGSGCIGISIARNRPDAEIILVEKSSDALGYLNRNVKDSECKNIRVINGDVLLGYDSFDLPKPDLVLSNPPYIESDDIKKLQSEVLHEPLMALDGGADGMVFYNAISEKWINECSAVAVECGEGQADSIVKLFSKKFADVYSVKDFNGIERVVVGRERI